jgi:hypothetical protein
MSTSLIVLIPVVMLGIVGMLCFVGCILDTSGLPATPFFEYSGKTVLANTPGPIAYWPLRETADTIPAAELVSNNTGNYIDSANQPTLFPYPLFPNIQNPPGPDIQSATAPGTITFGAPGIVKGDAVNPDVPAVKQPCIVVNGGYVEVPFNPDNTKFIPTSSFTVEAWVRVDWTASDTPAWRFVLDMRDLNPGRGFALFAKTDDNQPNVYRWAAMVGNGGSGTDGLTTVDSGELLIALSSPGLPAAPVYLALTYDDPSRTLTLFVNADQHGQVIAPTPHMPNSAQPFWIGAGAPFVDRRPQPDGVLSSPLFPFVGAIQDVAIYGAVLDAVAIRKHLNNGNGIDP